MSSSKPTYAQQLAQAILDDRGDAHRAFSNSRDQLKRSLAQFLKEVEDLHSIFEKMPDLMDCNIDLSEFEEPSRGCAQCEITMKIGSRTGLLVIQWDAKHKAPLGIAGLNTELLRQANAYGGSTETQGARDFLRFDRDTARWVPNLLLTQVRTFFLQSPSD